jgi:hypothetical protein
MGYREQRKEISPKKILHTLHFFHPPVTPIYYSSIYIPCMEDLVVV